MGVFLFIPSFSMKKLKSFLTKQNKRLVLIFIILFLLSLGGGAAIVYANPHIAGGALPWAGEHADEEPSPESDQQQEKKPNHTKAVIQSKPYQKTLEVVGTVNAEMETQLAPKATGKLHTLAVNVGDYVNQGQLIAQVSGEENYAQLASAQRGKENADNQYTNTQELMNNQVSASEAQRETSKANLDVLVQSRESLNTTAQKQLETATKQIEIAQKAYEAAPAEQQDIKLKQLELAQKEYDLLEANLNAQKAQLNEEIQVQENRVAESEHAISAAQRQRDVTIQNAESQKDTAEDSVTLAQILVNNTMVHAPYYGVVVEKHTELGQVVGAGQPVVTIANTVFQITIEVADTDIEQIQLDQTAEVTLDGLQGTYSAYVSTISPKVDPRTRTFPVELSFTEMPEKIKYGQSARITLHLDQTMAYFVPRAYVYPSYDGPYIIRADETKQFVETGIEHEDEIEISYFGITDGVELQQKEL